MRLAEQVKSFYIEKQNPVFIRYIGESDDSAVTLKKEREDANGTDHRTSVVSDYRLGWDNMISAKQGGTE